jgi:O-antigen ligase
MTLQVADERQEFRTSGWKELLALSVLFLYFLLSGYTLTAGEAGQGILGRVTYSDFVGLALIGIALVTSKRLFVPRQYLMYLPFLFAALLSLLVSGNVAQGTIEFLIHVFIWCVSLALLNIVMNAGPEMTERVFLTLLAAWFLIALAGLVQYLLFPSLFSGRVLGGVVGTFRNTGQSGSFHGLALAVIVPAMLAGLIRRNLITYMMAATILLAFILTFKRAAYVGFGAGLVLLLLMLATIGDRRDKVRALVVLGAVIVAVPLVGLLFEWGTQNIQYFEWRYRAKLSSDAIERFPGGLPAGEFAATWTAWSDHPMLGTGWGNIIGEYTRKHEIHSTYLGIVAQLGILGYQ